MTIYEEIEKEREHAKTRYSVSWDSRNTINDWTAYIVSYLGKAVVYPFNGARWRETMIKIAGLAVSAIEAYDTTGLHPRHYDS
jgi:hypothetical protein